MKTRFLGAALQFILALPRGSNVAGIYVPSDKSYRHRARTGSMAIPLSDRRQLQWFCSLQPITPPWPESPPGAGTGTPC